MGYMVIVVGVAVASLASADHEVYGDLVIACAALIGLMIAAAIGVYAVGRWMRRKPQGASAEPLTLEDLRSLYSGGQLSDEEFETAKARMIARLTGREVPGGEAAPVSEEQENLSPDEGTSSS